MDLKKFFWVSFLNNLIFLAITVLLWISAQSFYQSSPLGQFDLSSDRISKDLEGRQVAISHGQVWPFDAGQSLAVSVVAKKQIENYVVVVIDVRATASVEQSKDQKKEARVPTRVSVGGRLRLTYEKTGNEWYLVSVDGLTAKAVPQFD